MTTPCVWYDCCMKRLVDADEALGRMLRKTKPNGDCLEWQGQSIPFNEKTRRGGYGLAHKPDHLNYDLPEKTTAHRLAYAYVSGETPEVVMHSCDNRICINPCHLSSGTSRDNTQDMLNKGRGRWQK